MKAEDVWSPFYMDAMIETDTDPQVTTGQSNGSVDMSFGTNTSNGTTTTTLSSAVTAARAAVDPVDGNDIVVATMVGSTPELLFYTPSGALDTTYGSGTGIVSLSYSLTGINGLVVQENGLIDLAVTTSSGGMSVVELNANGTADTSFNSSGIKTLSGLPSALGIAIAGNGDVLVMGTSVNAFVVAELNPTTGALDTSYNTSGSASLTVAPSGSTIAFIGRAIAPDGDLILVAEYNAGSPAVPYLVIAAVDPSGQFDASFGTSGMFTQTTGSSASSKGISPVAVNAAGDIFVGRATNSGSNVTLNVSEYTPGGSVDTSFGTSGTASLGISGVNTGVILEIQLNGQIVIGAAGSGTSFELARFNPDGSRDMSFGSSGIETGASESAGFAMITAANGESIIIGKPSSGNGIILQEFHTLARTFTYYIEYDADYNVTSLADTSGNVLERYKYGPYGNVTVLNADGSVRGDGTAASSFYESDYLYQGMRYSESTGTYASETRIYRPSLGRWITEDPAGDVDGPNTYQDDLSDPAGNVDPSGCSAITAAGWWLGAGIGDLAIEAAGLGPEDIAADALATQWTLFSRVMANQAMNGQALATTPAAAPVPCQSAVPAMPQPLTPIHLSNSAQLVRRDYWQALYKDGLITQSELNEHLSQIEGNSTSATAASAQPASPQSAAPVSVPDAPVIQPGQVVDPTKVPVYRGGNGGNNLTAGPNDFKVDKSTGKVKPTRGPSLNTDPASKNVASRPGGACQIDSIPDELQIIQTGQKASTHVEIVPKSADLTPEQVQGLLNQVKFK